MKPPSTPRILLVCLLFATGPFCRADILHLKNGRSLTGVVLKETDTEIVLRVKVTTTTVKKSEIASIQRTEQEEAKETNERLPTWVRCLECAVKKDWVTNLEAIPATVIDKGILKNVPYKSFRSGDYELNIYGDPDKPAGIEIGIYRSLLASKIAKTNCIEFLASVLGKEDGRFLRSLNLSKDVRDRGDLTFEITPETDEDAYGGWWASVYSKPILDRSRASDQELQVITVNSQKSRSEKSSSSDDTSAWKASDYAMARGAGGTVYVRGYTRKDGTYVQAHTRSAPSSRK